MTERRMSSEKCANCPNRGRIAKLLARATRQRERAEGCEGVTTVSHGQIVTQIRTGNESSPPQNTWNSLTASCEYGGERRYSRTDWATETICGRETIEPRNGEVPFGVDGEFLRIHNDGRRTAAFIKGNEQELADHFGILSTMELLDNVSEMQDAEDNGDIDAARHAQEKIAQKGFEVVATSSRRGTKNDTSK